MAYQTQQYSPDQFLVLFGPIKIEGYADDTFIEVGRKTPTYNSSAGADGEVVRNRSLDKRGEIKLTLKQTSPTCALLDALLVADEIAPNGASILPVMVKDNSGNAVWSGVEAWVTEPAKTKGAKNAGDREYLIEVAKLMPPVPAHA
jgi:hypothetical protein